MAPAGTGVNGEGHGSVAAQGPGGNSSVMAARVSSARLAISELAWMCCAMWCKNAMSVAMLSTASSSAPATPSGATYASGSPCTVRRTSSAYRKVPDVPDSIPSAVWLSASRVSVASTRGENCIDTSVIATRNTEYTSASSVSIEPAMVPSTTCALDTSTTPSGFAHANDPGARRSAVVTATASAPPVSKIAPGRSSIPTLRSWATCFSTKPA